MVFVIHFLFYIENYNPSHTFLDNGILSPSSKEFTCAKYINSTIRTILYAHIFIFLQPPSHPWDEGVKCKIKTPAWLVYCCLSCFEMFFCVFLQMFTLPSAILSFVLCLSCLTFVVLVCLGLVACMCLLLISCFIFHRSAIDFKLDLSCCKIIVSSGLPPPPLPLPSYSFQGEPG